jgi:hypothetical protein
LGLVLGIVLATLSLSKLPFVVGSGLVFGNAALWTSDAVSDWLGGPPAEPTRQSLPSDEVARPTGVASLEHSGAASTVPSPHTPLATDRTALPSTSGAVWKLAVDTPRPTSLPAAPASSQNDVAQEEPQTLLKHARFLIKAGLAPMAADPLRKVVQEAPGTPIAQEAQQTLDSLSRN